MESKAFLINRAMQVCKFTELMEGSLKGMLGDVDLDSVLPKGWMGSISQAYKDTLDETYTYDEVEALVGWYESPLGSSVMSKLLDIQVNIKPRLEKIFV